MFEVLLIPVFFFLEWISLTGLLVKVHQIILILRSALVKVHNYFKNIYAVVLCLHSTSTSRDVLTFFSFSLPEDVFLTKSHKIHIDIRKWHWITIHALLSREIKQWKSYVSLNFFPHKICLLVFDVLHLHMHIAIACVDF